MKLFIALLVLLSLSACKASPSKEAICMAAGQIPIQVQEDKNTRIDVSRFGVVTITRGSESISLSLANCLVQTKEAE